MTAATRAALAALARPEYRNFQQALLPGVENYLGVRLPLLQKMAREMIRGDWRTELAAPDKSFEETMLRGLITGRLALPWPEKQALIADFVTRIDNWSVCDSFCAAFKDVPAHPAEYWALARRYAAGEKEFEARFAAVLLLWHFAGAEALPHSLVLYQAIRQPGFYARMGVAWGYSVFAATDFEATLAAMGAAGLDDITWNKALQKMWESRRLTPGQKQRAGELKRR